MHASSSGLPPAASHGTSHPRPGNGERDEHLDAAALEQIASVLTESGEYRVMRRFRPRPHYHDAGGAPTATALFVDVETTGLDTTEDVLIEFAAVPFTYRKDTGDVCCLGTPLVALEDPGRPISPQVTALTRITDDMVRGRRVDDRAVEQLLAAARLVIAHNAAFDRKVLERRFPMFAKMHWACSLHDVPWAEYGVRGTKLEYLLMHRCGEFHDGHRAEADCQAAIHLLATPLPCGTLPFRLLLESARRGRVRVWAVGSPYASRDRLRARGYKWSGDAGVNGQYQKTWYRDCDSTNAADAEFAWLDEHVYARGSSGGGVRGAVQLPADPVRQVITARERFSIRC